MVELSKKYDNVSHYHRGRILYICGNRCVICVILVNKSQGNRKKCNTSLSLPNNDILMIDLITTSMMKHGFNDKLSS